MASSLKKEQLNKELGSSGRVVRTISEKDLVYELAHKSSVNIENESHSSHVKMPSSVNDAKVNVSQSLNEDSELNVRITMDSSRNIEQDESSSPIQRDLRHGRITFKDVHKKESEGEPYLCLGSDASIAELCKVMEEDWHINMPTIVLHVITGIRQQGTISSRRQKENLKEGIIASANKTNMWIITNGINCGFVKTLGECVSKEKRRRDTLTCRRHPKESAPKLPKLTLIGIVREESLRCTNLLCGTTSVELVAEWNDSIENRYMLNPHHTHFIIVNDKTDDGTGLEKFVVNFADFLKRPATGTSRELPVLAGSKIPMIGLLLGGGFRSTRMVQEYLMNHVPVVVLKGTEGAADLLAFAYEEIKGKRASWDPDYVANFVLPELSQKISMYFEKYRIDNHYRIKFRDMLLSCVNTAQQGGRSFLTILDMHDSKCDLSLLNEHLMKAMFRAERRTGMDANYYVRRDLLIALDWNCPHICELEIFTERTQKYEIESNVFKCALRRQDREDFVDLFLDKGFNLGKYINPARLYSLFEKAENQEFFQSVVVENGLISTLTNPSILIVDLNGLIYRMAKIRNFVNLREVNSERDDDVAERRAVNALIIFAVFMYRPNLTKILWKRAAYPIHLGLLISMLFKKLADYTFDTHLSAELNESSIEFAKMSIGVLQASYAARNCRAIDILSEEVSDYDYKTAVEMAATARNRHFIAQPSCQKWLSSLFNGEIAVRDHRAAFFKLPSWLKIVLSAFLIFPIYFWIIFKPKKSSVSELFGRYGREGRLVESVHEMNKVPVQLKRNDLTSAYSSPQLYNRKVMMSDSNILNQPITRNNFKQTSKPELSLWKKVSTLWNAPIAKFWTHQIFYIMYLTLFGVTVLWPSCGLFYLDLSLWIWTLLILLEEVYITYMQYKHFSSKRLTSGVVEIFIMSAFLLIFLFVRILPSKQIRHIAGYFPMMIFGGYGARVVMCLGLIYFFCRFIWIYFPISATLGRFLFRLKEMVTNDFVQFLRLALLFIVSYGIAIHSVIYPDYPMSWELIRRVFHKAWFSLFLTPIEDLPGNPTCSIYPYEGNNTCRIGPYHSVSCPVTGVWPYILTIVYFVILKLILITLLFALFSYTAAKLEADSDAIWRYQRYYIVLDFYVRPRLPAPLNIFSFIVIFCTWLWKFFRRCGKLCQKKSDELETIHDVKSGDPAEDYYWKGLSEEYLEGEEMKDHEANLLKKQADKQDLQLEMMETFKALLQQNEVRLSELEKVMQAIRLSQEQIKHSIVKKEETSSAVKIHLLARQPLYPNTNITRFQIPDKYVPWDRVYSVYDPVSFTASKEKYPAETRMLVDDNVYKGKFKWNQHSIDSNGVPIDRRSWIKLENDQPLQYKLDAEGLPLNPLGRTGLKGRGHLHRWGPNHTILLVISRWYGIANSSRPYQSIEESKCLEFLVVKQPSGNAWSLPGGFDYGEETPYNVLKKVFKVQDDANWDADAMIEYFSRFASTTTRAVDASSSDKCINVSLLFRNYLDDPGNTDNAWIEAETWHFHYTGEKSIDVFHLRPYLQWKPWLPNLEKKMIQSHASILQEFIQNFEGAQ